MYLEGKRDSFKTHSVKSLYRLNYNNHLWFNQRVYNIMLKLINQIIISLSKCYSFGISIMTVYSYLYVSNLMRIEIDCKWDLLPLRGFNLQCIILSQTVFIFSIYLGGKPDSPDMGCCKTRVGYQRVQGTSLHNF